MHLLLSCFGSLGPGDEGKEEQQQRRHHHHQRLAPHGREAAAAASGSEGQGRRVRRKVVVVGDGESGKTCLLQRFSRDTYSLSGYLPTVFETEVAEVALDSTTTVELVLTDTAGQEDYDRLRPYAYPDADVIVVCFALDDHDSLENVRRIWLPEVRAFCGREVPVLMVGTKSDLRVRGEKESRGSSSISSEELAGRDEGRSWPSFLQPSARLIKQGPVKESTARRMAAELGVLGYWETSALLDQGVTEVFRVATRAALTSRCKRRVKGDKGRLSHRTSSWSRSILARMGVKR